MEQNQQLLLDLIQQIIDQTPKRPMPGVVYRDPNKASGDNLQMMIKNLTDMMGKR